MKAVFLDLASLDKQDLDLSALQGAVTCFEAYASTGTDQVGERIRDAEIVIVNKVILDASALQAARRLKLVCIAATGTNNVDLNAAAAQGIQVTNCQAYGTASVAQHVLGLMLALHTNLLAYNRAARNGDWVNASQFCLLDFPIQELSGKTLGIVGYGALGQEVGRLASAFGMTVVVAQRAGGAPVPGRLPLSELLTKADVISLHCPLTEATRNLISAAELALMKPGSFLINAARGGIVDEVALADALRAGRLAGAATDVLTVEPPTADNPLLAADIPNLIITPHSAWGSVQARQRIVDQLAESMRSYADGDTARRIV